MSVQLKLKSKSEIIFQMAMEISVFHLLPPFTYHSHFFARITNEKMYPCWPSVPKTIKNGKKVAMGLGLGLGLGSIAASFIMRNAL